MLWNSIDDDVTARIEEDDSPKRKNEWDIAPFWRLLRLLHFWDAARQNDTPAGLTWMFTNTVSNAGVTWMFTNTVSNAGVTWMFTNTVSNAGGVRATPANTTHHT